MKQFVLNHSHQRASANGARRTTLSYVFGGLCAALLLLAGVGAQAQVSFVNTVNYPMTAPGPGESPTSVALADFNGDGKLDMVVGNNFPGSIYVTFRLGNGDGTFGSISNLVVDSEPAFLVATDVNDDGYVDILTANPLTDDISVLFGRGDGTFELRQDYDVPLGAAPVALVTGDFNFDGTNDFISANSGNDTISVFVGLGDDTFTNLMDYNVFNGPNLITKGDFNGDGRRDVAVVNGTANSVSILLGYGDGSLAEPVTFSAGAGTAPVAIVVDDFDHDGDQDLIIAKSGGDLIVGLTNNLFAAFSQAFTLPAIAPAGMVVSDLNHDGTNDLAIVLTGGTVAVRRGVASGYGAAQAVIVGTTPQSVAAGEFTGDQAPDLVVANFASGDVSVLANRTPVAEAFTVVLLEDSSTNIVLRGTTNTTLTYEIMATTTNGTSASVGILAGPNVTYTPNANFFGTDHLRYRVTDGVIVSPIVSVTFTVLPVNDAPSFTILDPAVEVNEDARAQSMAAFATSITKGPANENSQGLAFLLSNDNTNLFRIQPNMTSVGRLTFQPAPNSNGTATVTAILQDSGGTNSGGDNRFTNTFTITVNAVNDAPTFTQGTNVVVVEDCGPQSFANWATNMNVGPADEAAQTLSFLITANNNPTLFSSAPAIDPAGTLSFTPAANSNGLAILSVRLQDTGDNLNGGTNTGLTKTFRITVKSVNDQPTFTLDSALVGVLEDSGMHTNFNFATNMDTGAFNESNQLALYYFTLSNDNPAIFAYQPAIDHNGTLKFSSKANSNGTANVSVVLNDRGGVLDGGIDKVTNFFTIVVTNVNDPPTIRLGSSPYVLEDCGPVSTNGWASSIGRGPADEIGQNLSFVVFNDNPGLFTATGQPAIDGNGTLTFEPAPDSNGVASVDVVVQDDGGTAFGGINNSAGQTFRIVVNPVNDAPTFTLAYPSIQVYGTNGLVTTNIFSSTVPGPQNETNQVLSYVIGNKTNTVIFAVQPTISAAGILSFKTRGAAFFGEVNLTIRSRDNGGAAWPAAGGTNQSTVDTLNITILPP